MGQSVGHPPNHSSWPAPTCRFLRLQIQVFYFVLYKWNTTDAKIYTIYNNDNWQCANANSTADQVNGIGSSISCHYSYFFAIKLFIISS